MGIESRGCRDFVHRVLIPVESPSRARSLAVRRIPDANSAEREKEGQDGLFGMWRFHALFTTQTAEQITMVAADRQHRAHAFIEQDHADPKASAAAHMPSGVFTANAAWLVCAVIAFNLTRATATCTGATGLARATTSSIRRKIISVPARIAFSARRLALHLPAGRPWQTPWGAMHSATIGARPPDRQPQPPSDRPPPTDSRNRKTP